MAITTTVAPVVDRSRRLPRTLESVADITSLIAANGFSSTDLIPGDQVFVQEGSDSPESSLCIRNAANDGWKELVLHEGFDFACYDLDDDDLDET